MKWLYKLIIVIDKSWLLWLVCVWMRFVYGLSFGWENGNNKFVYGKLVIDMYYGNIKIICSVKIFKRL